jgi:hypothetical protein
MNTVCSAQITKSGNPPCDKSHVELTLRVIPHASDNTLSGTSNFYVEVTA